MKIKTKEAAKYLGISASKLNLERCYGPRPGSPAIPYIKLRHSVLCDTDDLDRILEQCSKPGFTGGCAE